MADHKPRIVIVDKDAAFLTEMERSLPPLYEVTALSGEWSYAQIAALAPDLIMLDVHMADRGAFGLCRSLRADARFAKTPIVFMAGAKTDEEYRLYLCAGGSRFLYKVIARRHLLAALSEELSAARPVAAAK